MPVRTCFLLDMSTSFAEGLRVRSGQQCRVLQRLRELQKIAQASSAVRPSRWTIIEPLTDHHTDMLPRTRTDPQENPLCCALRYRGLGQPELADGAGIGWSARNIRFQGSTSAKPGAALEIRLDAVRGLIPALMILAEVTSCEAQGRNRFELAAAIRGILAL